MTDIDEDALLRSYAEPGAERHPSVPHPFVNNLCSAALLQLICPVPEVWRAVHASVLGDEVQFGLIVEALATGDDAEHTEQFGAMHRRRVVTWEYAVAVVGAAQAGYAIGLERGDLGKITAYLRRDDGRYLERYVERRRVADEVERGAHLAGAGLPVDKRRNTAHDEGS